MTSDGPHRLCDIVYEMDAVVQEIILMIPKATSYDRDTADVDGDSNLGEICRRFSEIGTSSRFVQAVMHGGGKKR